MALNFPPTRDVVDTNQDPFSQSCGVIRRKPRGNGFKFKASATASSNHFDFGQTDVCRHRQHVPVEVRVGRDIVIKNTTAHPEIGNMREGVKRSLGNRAGTDYVHVPEINRRLG